MRWLTNLKISSKVAGMIFLLGILSLGLAVFTASRIGVITNQYSTLVDHNLPANTDIARANRRAIEMVYIGYKAAAHGAGRIEDGDFADKLKTSYDKGRKNLAEAVATDFSLESDVKQLVSMYDQVHDLVEKAVTLNSRGRNDEALRVLAETDTSVEAFMKAGSDLTYKRVDTAKVLTQTVESFARSTEFGTMIMSVVAMIGAMAVAMIAVRFAIVRPLMRLQDGMRGLAGGNNQIEIQGLDRTDEVGQMAQAVLVFRNAAQAQAVATEEKSKADADQKMVVDTVSHHLEALAGGDLTKPIAADFPATYFDLKNNFNQALGRLGSAIGAVSRGATSIRAGSTEIAQASEDLARRTESNAASLEETAAAITQMDGRLKASATAALRTVERADQAITTVGGGRAVADEAVQAMGRVSDSTKGIDSVIEGLDKIAFQTRVLAMNAAVEAGRAGDAGRGFAVVADLVSALAMRAEEEAKRARDQLSVTQTDIVTAVEAVRKVDDALTDISGDVGQVHELLATMAADNQAQSAAITQISVAIGTMDQVTQQNAAMVEENSAAARNLNSEVSTLADHAASFTVDAAEETKKAAPSNVPAQRETAKRSPPPKFARSVARRELVTDANDWAEF